MLGTIGGTLADLFETVNVIAELLGARKPQWVDQPGPFPNGIPAASNAGVSLQNSPRTQVVVDLREEAHRRSVRIAFAVADLTVSIYRTIIDGNTVDFDASVSLPADLAALAQGIADGIAASAPANTIVTATAVDSTGAGGPVDTVLLRGLAETDYPIALSVIGGTGEMTGTVDAVSATALVWFSAKPPNAPGTWRQANGAVYAVTTRGFIERFDTAGLDFGYVELQAVTGDAGDGATPPTTLTTTAAVTHGPSVRESSD